MSTAISNTSEQIRKNLNTLREVRESNQDIVTERLLVKFLQPQGIRYLLECEGKTLTDRKVSKHSTNTRESGRVYWTTDDIMNWIKQDAYAESLFETDLIYRVYTKPDTFVTENITEVPSSFFSVVRRTGFKIERMYLEFQQTQPPTSLCFIDVRLLGKLMAYKLAKSLAADFIVDADEIYEAVKLGLSNHSSLDGKPWFELGVTSMRFSGFLNNGIRFFKMPKTDGPHLPVKGVLTINDVVDIPFMLGHRIPEMGMDLANIISNPKAIGDSLQLMIAKYFNPLGITAEVKFHSGFSRHLDVHEFTRAYCRTTPKSM